MMKNMKFMLMGAAATALLLHASPVQAQETVVKTQTVTQTTQVMPKTGTRIINFADFDLNADKTMSTFEIGEMLFKLFDADGNEVIDNVEFENRNVMTIVPMQKETVVSFDFDNDGVPDEIHRTYENVLKDTQLTRFDNNLDGISPHEFAGKSFMEMDLNRSKAIEQNEWRGAYIASIAEKNENQVLLNK